MAILLILVVLATPEAPGENATSMIIVVGADGAPEFGKHFTTWVERWQQAAQRTGANWTIIGRASNRAMTDRDRAKQALAIEPKDGDGTLWVVLIGHGTYDGRSARFNLRGPDVTDDDLADWLDPFRRPVVVINCASASGPFVHRLSAPGRVVVTATKSGSESAFACFGDYLSQAILEPEADLDNDGQASLLEAYLNAARRVAEFYHTEARLATEHALLDDNGDGRGTPADWFRGLRPVKRAADGAALDGYLAHQCHLIPNQRERNLPAPLRRKRDQLELEVLKLRDAKAQCAQDEYFGKLETLLLELARLYEEADRLAQSRTLPEGNVPRPAASVD